MLMGLPSKYRTIHRFVDRDMYMCYKGGGVGHCAIKVHNTDRNMAKTDIAVNNESEYDLDENGVPFNDLDDESDMDLEGGDSDVEEAEDEDGEDLCMEEDEDELEYI